MLVDFSYQEQNWQIIQDRLLNYQKSHPGPYIAAFDADGTLWGKDGGEAFFAYQIKHNLVPLPPDPWGHYFNLKKEDPRKAYLWLAQIGCGKTLDEVRSWGEGLLKEEINWPYFSAQKKLIQWLQHRGFSVYVVTASIKWAVEPFVKAFDLPFSSVIGVETQVQQGVITDLPYGPVTWREGKVEKLLQVTGGHLPLLAAGNTSGDLHLLESSKLVQIAIHSSHPHESVYVSEQELKQIATNRSWLIENWSAYSGAT